MSKILIATNNRGKLGEFQALLGDLGEALVTPADLGLALEVDETGATYAENAALKARAFSQASGLICLADDSGLEVDALGGQPGLYSHRIAAWPGASDADRRRALLARLAGQPEPWTACFRCVVALARPEPAGAGPLLRFAEGVCPGQIIPHEQGENGFGFDPIFWLPEVGRTMAQLTMDEKNRLSHRARATLAARPILSEWLQAAPPQR